MGADGRTDRSSAPARAGEIVTWVVLAVFALVLLLPDAFPRTFGSPLVEPAVILLPLLFVLVHGARRYGVTGILVFLALCFGISNIMENVGVATGFPFGRYHYTDVMGPKLGLVPLLIGPSYAGMGYVSLVLAKVLLGTEQRPDPWDTVSVPVVAAFIMVGWDVCMDPAYSTVNRNWIWEKGGGYFGVPFVNFLGWFLTVYLFQQLFALYEARWCRPPVPALPMSHWLQASAFMFLWALDFLAYYAGYDDVPVTDAAGRTWQTGDIYATGAVISLVTLLFVAVLSFFVIVRRRYDPPS